MNKPHRLFDFFNIRLKEDPDAVMVGAKESGQWRTYSVKQVKETVDQLSAGLLAMGYGSGNMTVEGRDKIALLSKNRIEWLLLDLATQQIGVVLVPLYPTIHISDLEFILNDAQVKSVFVNDEDLYHKVQNVRSRVPSIREIFSFEHISGTPHWKEILSMGKQEHYHQLSTAVSRINSED